jgi:hypothetical protein
MSGKAPKVKCTEKQMEVLEQIIKSKRSQARMITRAKMIRYSFDGKLNGEISELIGLTGRLPMKSSSEKSLKASPLVKLVVTSTNQR